MRGARDVAEEAGDEFAEAIAEWWGDCPALVDQGTTVEFCGALVLVLGAGGLWMLARGLFSGCYVSGGKGVE